jgi:hypothetical protein
MLSNFVNTVAHLRDSVLEKRGLGLLITGPSRDERLTLANIVIDHVARRRCAVSVAASELVAARHHGWFEREFLVAHDVMLINDLGALSQGEEAAIDVMDPTFTVTSTLEHILDQGQRLGVSTLVSTQYELAELETQFGPRLAGLVEALGFSIRLDGEDG